MPTPTPSASILLLSPTNTILLLHRLQTSSTFPSAHVFPGGAVQPSDGPAPTHEEEGMERDCRAYRVAGVRECFEECGILLARDGKGMLEVRREEREEGRRRVLAGSVGLEEWVAEREGVLDLDGLIPFTHWITPASVPRRFATQMYLYFLPLPVPSQSTSFDLPHYLTPTPSEAEHTTTTFHPPGTWLSLASAGEVVLYPPQLYLLSLLASFLPPPAPGAPAHTAEVLEAQRTALLRAVQKEGWDGMVISPEFERKAERGRMVLGLGKSRGDAGRVVVVERVAGGGGLRALRVCGREELEREGERGGSGEL